MEKTKTQVKNEKQYRRQSPNETAAGIALIAHVYCIQNGSVNITEESHQRARRDNKDCKRSSLADEKLYDIIKTDICGNKSMIFQCSD